MKGEYTMEILLLGNGFDLEHKLPTTYKNFLDFCLCLKNVYTVDLDMSRAAFAQNYIKGWKFNEHVDKVLYDAFDSRHFDLKAKKTTEEDSQIRTKFPELNEMYSYIQFNSWLEYFWELPHHTYGTWIDFESEISIVIQALDNLKQHLTIHNDITEGNVNGDSILMRILKASKGSLNAFKSVKSVEHFSSFLNTELDKLIRTLELYISYIVNKIPVSRTSSDIQKLNPNCILSFNYSDTYQRVYGKNKNIQYGYIHGKADCEKTLQSCNLVLGIDEYLAEDKKCVELEFLTFKKYYQRIYKSTGNEYLDWIDEIKDGYTDYINEIENEKKLKGLPPQIRPQTLTIDGKTYVKGSIKKFPHHTLYVFGHSLDKTDRDILKLFICNDNVQTKIFYHRENVDDKKSLSKIIRNLIQIMGPDELIRRTGGAHKTIEFIPQELHDE